MMPKPLPPTPALHLHDQLLAEVLALRPEVERILQRDSRPNDSARLEDQMQVVLLNVTRHLNEYQPHVDGMRPWLTRIAQNVQRDSARSDRRQRRALGFQSLDPDEVCDEWQCTERRASARVLLLAVVKAMGHMPEPLRTVLVFVAFARLDHEQVAAKLGITVAAVKMRLLRAREYLREHAGTLDDHLAILAPVFVDARRMSTIERLSRFGGWFGPLLPPLLTGALALSNMEIPGSMFIQTAEAPAPRMLISVGSANERLPLQGIPTQTVLHLQPLENEPLPQSPSPFAPSIPIRIDVKPPGKTLSWRKTR